MLTMEPLDVAGVSMGAFLNVLNEMVLIVSLFMLLGFTARTSLSKLTKIHKKESKMIEEKESELSIFTRKEEENKEVEAESLIDDNRSADINDNEMKINDY